MDVATSAPQATIEDFRRVGTLHLLATQLRRAESTSSSRATAPGVAPRRRTSAARRTTAEALRRLAADPHATAAERALAWQRAVQFAARAC